MITPCVLWTAHDPHRVGLWRRQCPGLTWGFCDDDLDHSWHFIIPERGVACRGLGLAGVCDHGVLMLDGCDDCEVAR